jgi:hypothetical protein
MARYVLKCERDDDSDEFYVRIFSNKDSLILHLISQLENNSEYFYELEVKA